MKLLRVYADDTLGKPVVYSVVDGDSFPSCRKVKSLEFDEKRGCVICVASGGSQAWIYNFTRLDWK